MFRPIHFPPDFADPHLHHIPPSAPLAFFLYFSPAVLSCFISFPSNYFIASSAFVSFLILSAPLFCIFPFIHFIFIMFLQRPTLLLVAAAQALNAQSLDETIVGCAEVDCPTASDSTAAECQVADKDFAMIGLARVPTDTDALEGLSWVEGVALGDSDGNRTFDKTFFLGTPPDLDLNGTIACALFFTHVSDRVSFGDDGDDESISQGTCEEALSEKCVSALISRAEDLDFDGLKSAEVCKKLQEEFEDNLDSECDSFADGSKWVGLNSTGTQNSKTV